MSHITDARVRVRDLDALEQACDRLGLELQRDKKTYAWWGRFVGDSRTYGNHTPDKMGKCDHAIRIKGDRAQNGPNGPWEIGVVRSEDGQAYELYYDQFGAAGQRLTDRIGISANNLRREYTVASIARRATTALAREGFTMTREAVFGDRVRLRFVKR